MDILPQTVCASVDCPGDIVPPIMQSTDFRGGGGGGGGGRGGGGHACSSARINNSPLACMSVIVNKKNQHWYNINVFKGRPRARIERSIEQANVPVTGM